MGRESRGRASVCVMDGLSHFSVVLADALAHLPWRAAPCSWAPRPNSATFKKHALTTSRRDACTCKQALAAARASPANHAAATASALRAGAAPARARCALPWGSCRLSAVAQRSAGLRQLLQQPPPKPPGTSDCLPDNSVTVWCMHWLILGGWGAERCQKCGQMATRRAGG